jgi:hypothetical protein
MIDCIREDSIRALLRNAELYLCVYYCINEVFGELIRLFI